MCALPQLCVAVLCIACFRILHTAVALFTSLGSVFFTATHLCSPDPLIGRTKLSPLLYAHKNGGGRQKDGDIFEMIHLASVCVHVSVLVCHSVHVFVCQCVPVLTFQSIHCIKALPL